VPYLTGREKKSPRNYFFYFSDDGDMIAIRMDNWKIVFMEQRTPGGLAVWRDPFVRLRAPLLYNLRTDPYEFATVTSNTYNDWFMQRAYLIYATQAAAAKFAETFKEFPAVQKPNTFTVDDALAKMSEAAGGAD
jgi:arylsulfatase A-like enzyme